MSRTTARDLFWGVGGKRLAPDPAATYTVIEIKRTGFSRGYTVSGPDRARVERQISTGRRRQRSSRRRIHWGIGYHQPPIYYVHEMDGRQGDDSRTRSCRRGSAKRSAALRRSRRQWHLVVLPEPVRRHAAAQGPARAAGDARQLGPQGRQQRDLRAARSRRRRAHAGTWRAILVTPSAAPACSMRHAATSKSSRRRRSSPASSTEGHASTGAAGTTRSSATSRRPTCAGFAGDCSSLTDSQWRDAFRAGGYPPEDAERFIRRMKQKDRRR